MRIRCSDLGVSYASGGRTIDALAGVTLEIGEGEFVSLVGPSGCGKTSLLRTLAGFVRPCSGTMTVRRDTGSGSIGWVSQEDSLFPWMTVLENATFALEMGAFHELRANKRPSPCSIVLDWPAASEPIPMSFPRA